jgi:hypothetical protein
MSQTIYTVCNPIIEECQLFQNPGRTIPASAGFYWDGTNCWEVGFNGFVIAQGTCVTTTTTTTTTSTTTTTTTAAGNEVSIYFRAGDTINNGDTFDIYTSQDNTNWTLFSIDNSSTFCTFYGTVTISSGTIYVKAQRSSDNAQVYIRANNSTTCPANTPFDCTYSTAITGTESVAITVYVEDDEFGNLGLLPCL